MKPNEICVNGREWNLFELNPFREALVILLNHMVSLFQVSS